MEDLFSLFQKLDNISGRLEAIDLIEQYFSSISQEESVILTYLLQGEIAPSFVGAKLNYSEKNILSFLRELARVNDLKIDIDAIRSKVGDIGLTVDYILTEVGWQKQSSLSLRQVYDALWVLSQTSGSESVKAKSKIFADSVAKLSPRDALYFARISAGKMRLGFGIKTVIDVFIKHLLDEGCQKEKKELKEIFDFAYGVSSDLGYLAGMVYEKAPVDKKIEQIKNIHPIAGIPIYPQLVHRVGGFEEVFERYPDGINVQPKYDGLRVQLHSGVDYESDNFSDRIWTKYLKNESSVDLFGGGEKRAMIKLFSRNLQDLTDMFPDITVSFEEIISKHKNLEENTSIILDGEVVGLKDGKYIPFQEIMLRKRKYDVEEMSKSVPAYYFVFDVLLLGDDVLINKPFEKRQVILQKILNVESDRIRMTETKFAENIASLKKLFTKDIEAGLEGIVLKVPNTKYLPGVRNYTWIKLKKSLESKMVDTIDGVVLGYYIPSGNKLKTGIGALLLGVYNKESGKYETVCKVGTGMSDEDRSRIYGKLQEIIVDKEPLVDIDKALIPDVWVNPEIVVTVEADEITKSNVHTAGKSLLEYGLALRFPRLKEFGRDKTPEDATSTQELVEMYKMRKGG